MVSTLASGSSGPSSRPSWGHCVVFLGRHFTLTVPLSTQVYKWVPLNLMLGVTLRWTSIPSGGKGRGGSRNNLCRFMPQKLEISAGLIGHLARIQTYSATQLTGWSVTAFVICVYLSQIIGIHVRNCPQSFRRIGFGLHGCSVSAITLFFAKGSILVLHDGVFVVRISKVVLASHVELRRIPCQRI